MTDARHDQLLRGFADAMNRQEWDRLGDFLHADAVVEYPQSRERFLGLAEIRAQFEEYPGLEAGSSELQEVIGGTTYVLTPAYTVVGVEGSGDRGIAIIRVRYPDQTMWWVVNLYELRGEQIARMRVFFAPEFEPPEWRRRFQHS